MIGGRSAAFRILVSGALLGVVSAAAPPVAGLTGTAATTAQLVGQKLMVAMSGTTPSSSLLGRITRGEVGGVILFGSNITTAAALKSLTTKLQAAAKSGGQPPL